MKISPKKSWLTKLNPDQQVKLTTDKRNGDSMLIPTPMLMADEIRRIPKGKVRRIGVLRDKLARDDGVERTCPMVAGIFMSILAGAAEEQFAAGRKRVVAPYWRVLQDDGSVRSKEPPGVERQVALLEAEGHVVVRKGKKWILAGMYGK
ncbi:MAG: MGMT family protein [Planctomycetota bacterium]|jgi:alkylated DNA nucleotide flippase Atl1